MERVRIHWYLQQKIDRVEISEKLPVYIVVAERLRYDHWFPRVNRLRIDERRLLVLDELKEHAARTQGYEESFDALLMNPCSKLATLSLRLRFHSRQRFGLDQARFQCVDRAQVRPEPYCFYCRHRIDKQILLGKCTRQPGQGVVGEIGVDDDQCGLPEHRFVFA